MTRYHGFLFSLVHLCTFHGVHQGYIKVKAVLLRPSTVDCIYILRDLYLQIRYLRGLPNAAYLQTTYTEEHEYPEGAYFGLPAPELRLATSPRLGSERASIPTEHKKVPTYRIREMRGLPILSQHVQTSNTLTNLAVNNDCHGGVDSPLSG
jgi:hypothetical protein